MVVQYYLHGDRGRAGLAAYRREFARLLWQEGSPDRSFTDDEFAATAASFDNPDFVDIVVHSYRHRYGLAAGDPAHQELENELSTQPPIPVPTVVIDPRCDPLVHHILARLPTEFYGVRMTGQSQTITVSHPPPIVLKVVNPVLRLLLHTPLLGAAREQFMVISFKGRKTGRPYTIPLSAHRIDDNLYALTGAPWKRNFRDGATAKVLLDGKTTTMHGELIQGRAATADLYRRCSESYGVKRAERALGLKFRDQQLPSLEDFTQAVQRDHLVAIRFTPE